MVILVVIVCLLWFCDYGELWIGGLCSLIVLLCAILCSLYFCGVDLSFLACERLYPWFGWVVMVVAGLLSVGCCVGVCVTSWLIVLFIWWCTRSFVYEWGFGLLF